MLLFAGSNTVTNLAKYNNDWYDPGASLLKRILWLWCNAVFFDSWLIPISSIKLRLLTSFGAEIGEGVVIKPRVKIKYPWRLKVGAHSWIGEGVWIDNLAEVVIAENVCVSQGALLLTGNHDYSDPAFGLKVAPIEIQGGAWIGAKSVVCPGARISEHVVITVASVIGNDTEPYGIYRGSPAQLIKKRDIRDV